MERRTKGRTVTSPASSTESNVTRAEICVIACAEIFSGAGETMASPMATTPLIGARLARLTSEPDLLITDGEAFCRTLPERIGVAAVPVSVFADDKDPWRHMVRFAFSKRDEVIAEAARRLRRL